MTHEPRAPWGDGAAGEGLCLQAYAWLCGTGTFNELCGRGPARLWVVACMDGAEHDVLKRMVRAAGQRRQHVVLGGVTVTSCMCVYA